VTEEERQPTEEEMRAAFEEQMKNVTVSDVLLQTSATLVNLAARKLGLAGEQSHEKDLDQAKLAIDATRALSPLVSDEQGAQIKQALTQVQMAYAREAQAQGRTLSEQDIPNAQQQPQPQTSSEDPDQAQRDRARSKLWTPPGS
jgi:hypothetical protein